MKLPQLTSCSGLIVVRFKTDSSIFVVDNIKNTIFILYFEK